MNKKQFAKEDYDDLFAFILIFACILYLIYDIYSIREILSPLMLIGLVFACILGLALLIFIFIEIVILRKGEVDTIET